METNQIIFEIADDPKHLRECPGCCAQVISNVMLFLKMPPQNFWRAIDIIRSLEAEFEQIQKEKHKWN